MEVCDGIFFSEINGTEMEAGDMKDKRHDCSLRVHTSVTSLMLAQFQQGMFNCG